MKARIHQSAAQTRRVALLFDKKPQPLWRFSTEHLFSARQHAKVIPVVYDGRFWVESLISNGARVHRVVRHGWPMFDADARADTDSGWLGKMANAHGDDLIIRDLQVTADRSYRSIWSYWPMLAAVAGLFILWQISIWLFTGSLSAFAYWAGLVIRGGIGNVPVAKDILGIDRPFLLTPYQLDRHVGSNLERQIAEGLMERAA